MKELTCLRKVTILLGTATLASFVSFPALAQFSSRSNIVNALEPDRTSETLMSQEDPASQGDPATGITALDREFMIMAAQGNNAEIQTSELALQASQDEAVRSYAEQMIQEHTLANERLTQIATQYGVTLPADPGPLNAAIAEQLAQLSGEEFDQAYIGVQENAHLKTIALYRTAISQGQAPDVTSYASELLPNITNHYEMARQMNSQSEGNVQRPLQ